MGYVKDYVGRTSVDDTASLHARIIKSIVKCGKGNVDLYKGRTGLSAYVIRATKGYCVEVDYTL